MLGAPVAYYYSPAFLQVFSPLLALLVPCVPRDLVRLSGAALVAVARSWLPLALVDRVRALEVLRGNIETLMALAIVAGFRWPAAWAFILLTKVTPGVGLLWFVGRRDWRSLGIAIGATALIAAVSFVLAPAQWSAWVASLIGERRREHRLAVLPGSAARPPPDRRGAGPASPGGAAGAGWCPIASTLAMPALWPVNLTLLVAIFPLLRSAGGGEGR